MDMHSGIDGTATVGSDELPITGWTVNITGEIVRFRNSKTNRGTLKEPTFRDGAGTITVDFDFDENPFGSPFTMATGTRLSNVKLYLRKTADPVDDTEPYWDFPSVILGTIAQTLEIEGKIQTTFNFEVDGEFGYPGQAVGS
jgi:hypothetical protein